MPQRERVSASGPGGAEPACHRGAPAPLARPSRPAFGRLLATPTFLAGACIVVVAIMAYGTTQTHLLFSGLPPACQSASCSRVGPGGANDVPLKTSARPVTSGRPGSAAGAQQRRVAGPPATSPTPAASPLAGGQRPPQHPAPQHPAPRPPAAAGLAGPEVSVFYHTLRRFPGGFLAAITMWNRGPTALAGWQLWMHYRQARIDYARGARWFPADSLSRMGLVAPPVGQGPLRPETSVRFVLHVTGPSGWPSDCVFDGYRCTFRRQPA